MNASHQPVLLRETLEYLAPKPGQTIVDGTLGLGGHAREIAARLGAQGKLVGVERDERTLKETAKCLHGPNITLVLGNFADLPGILKGIKIPAVDGIFLDLGISSCQLADPAYGLSWQVEAPLDMRLTGEGNTALEVIRHLNEKDLTDALYRLADERHSRPIARALKEHYRELKTTTDLERVIEQAVGRRGRLHPATKTFLALRILVNRELPNLEEFLRAAAQCLAPGGRLVIISFHSGEDRLVKQAFKDKNIWQALTKKPIMASRDEERQNPRSRSAKLRAATLINSKLEVRNSKQ